MHAELVEQDRRQQLRPDEAARRGMERRRRLGDLFAIAAGELLAHCLDDLEAARDLLQRLGHNLSDLRQPRSAATGAARRSLDDDALVFDVVRPGLANTGRLRVKARTLCAFAAAACAASSSSLAVVTSSSSSNSSCSIRRAVRSERGPYSSRLSFSIRSSRCAI